MIAKQIKEKDFLAKLLEQGIKIILIKECKEISNIKIDIISTFTQIIKGEIQKINIIADDINYKDLLIDKLELEANHLKIRFKTTNKELYFINNPIINFKISLSQNSLSKVLLSNSWDWIGSLISKEILSYKQLKEIKIKNGQLLMKSTEKNKSISKEEQVNIITEKGKVYLENKSHNKSTQIPFENKVYVENINIENNLIIISANSPIDF